MFKIILNRLYILKYITERRMNSVRWNRCVDIMSVAVAGGVDKKLAESIYALRTVSYINIFYCSYYLLCYEDVIICTKEVVIYPIFTHIRACHMWNPADGMKPVCISCTTRSTRRDKKNLVDTCRVTDGSSPAGYSNSGLCKG